MSYFLLPRIRLPINEDTLLATFSPDVRPTFSVTVREYVTQMKEKIHDHLHEWDNYKKYTNPYEYIHTPVPGTNKAVSDYKPLSRSFYKMIEIINIHGILDSHKDSPIATFHLAEGPGGFIEAVSYKRNGICTGDMYYGMTLIDPDANVPGWKKSRDFVRRSNVHIETGADGTGDLLHLDNFDYCCDTYGGRMDVVTGDGGFDFSVNFNEQEKQATKLIYAQMAYAIMMQKTHGSFVLKIFDMFNRPTLEMVYILCSLYNKVMVYKPFTSRYANSERYIVCANFLPQSSEPYRGVLRRRLLEMTQTDEPVESILTRDMSLVFTSKIEEINAIFGQLQIVNIKNTMNLIANPSSEKIESIKRNNIQKCMSWCSKHSIPYQQSHTVKSNTFLAAAEE